MQSWGAILVAKRATEQTSSGAREVGKQFRRN
jgi:hypothetical protein